jgi:thiosulfate dehydrogenase (quinone) large subunit
MHKNESSLTKFANIFLRLALAAAFLAAVTDRFGVWGPPGTTTVAWGDFGRFLVYGAKLNPELPAAWIPVVGWIVTFAETIFAIALLLGFRTRMFALLSGLLLLAFAFGMTIGTGVKSALNPSVFSASAGAFLLATMREYSSSFGCFRKRVSMKKLFSLLLGMALMPGTATHAFAQDRNNGETKARDTDKAQNERTKVSMSIREKNIKVMLTLFNAVEQHDEQQQLELYQPNVEFHWPPSLYGGSRPGWDETWLALQPTARERRMDPRVVAASDDEVAVLYHQRGVSPTGERFDGEVLGLYQLRGGKLARAQMFYFDTAAVASFLARAITPQLQGRVQKVLSQLKSLPNERRRNVEQGFGKLQMMAPRQRPQLTNSDEFKRNFSEDERDLIKRMLDLNASHDRRAQSAPD